MSLGRYRETTDLAHSMKGLTCWLQFSYLMKNRVHQSNQQHGSVPPQKINSSSSLSIIAECQPHQITQSFDQFWYIQLFQEAPVNFHYSVHLSHHHHHHYPPTTAQTISSLPLTSEIYVFQMSRSKSPKTTPVLLMKNSTKMLLPGLDYCWALSLGATRLGQCQYKTPSSQEPKFLRRLASRSRSRSKCSGIFFSLSTLLPLFPFCL